MQADNILKSGSRFASYNFRDNLVDDITVGDNPEIRWGGDIVRFRHQGNNGVIDLFQELSRQEKVLHSRAKVIINYFPSFIEEIGRVPIQPRSFIIIYTEKG